MNFHDRAFEKAYLQIIKESADIEADVEVCPDCGGTGVLEDGTPCACVSAEVEQESVCPDCNGTGFTEDGTPCPCGASADNEDEIEDEIEEGTDDNTNGIEEDGEDGEDGEDAEADDAAVAEDEEAPAEGDEEAPAEGGKFISFFTTDENLIKALQDGFAKISVTGTDEKAEPVEFEADLFENLSVEDLKDDEEAPAEGDDEAAVTDDEELPAEEQEEKPAKK